MARNGGGARAAADSKILNCTLAADHDLFAWGRQPADNSAKSIEAQDEDIVGRERSLGGGKGSRYRASKGRRAGVELFAGLSSGRARGVRASSRSRSSKSIHSHTSYCAGTCLAAEHDFVKVYDGTSAGCGSNHGE